jgi:NAD(P)H-flavin reductase/hemoglobin-like flavoprotein
MPLNPQVVKESFSHIEPQAEKATAYFCGRLFAENPGLRSLFPPALDSQREQLFQSLARIVLSLDSPDALTDYLGRLGRDHRRFGVVPEHYPAVGSALIATVRRFSADAWTPEVEAAWTGVFASATRIMIEAAEASKEPPWWVAEVLEHELRTPDLAVLTVRPGQPLAHRAGQYVTIQTSRWPRVWRPYSIANAPRDDGLLRFHVRAQPAGWVSGTLVRYTKAGDTLLLGAADGAMTLEPESDRDLVFIAGGTGLGPMKALLQQAVAQDRRRDILVLVGARTREDLYDQADLTALEASWPRLRVIPVVSDDPGFDGMQGPVSDALGHFVPLDDHDIYVAGPPEMITATVTRLHEMGVAAARIHHDTPDDTGPHRHGPAAARKSLGAYPAVSTNNAETVEAVSPTK